jgi:hypothetical protein
LYKNLADLRNEEHHHPIKWIKRFLLGAFGGAIFGYSWFLFKPENGFTMKKLMAASGDRPWSGRTFRYA